MKSELVDILNIHRYLAKEASAAERKELEQWLGHSEENKRLFKSYQKIYQVEIEHTKEFNTERALQKFKMVMDDQSRKISPTNTKKRNLKHRRSRSTWLKVASVVVMGVLSSLYIFTSSGLFDQDVVEIVQESEGLFIHTEVGEQKTFRLKDGTRIRLNASSSVHIHPGYGDSLRTVTLKGEAFFEVAHNPDLEFVAETKSANISVLGTSFSVRAWGERDESIVAVEEGRVSVRSSNLEIDNETILNAGEYSQTRMDEAPGPARSTNFDQYIGWKNQMFVFEETPLIDVLHQLELHFNVQITIKDSTTINDPVTARYGDESLDQILRYTSITHEVEFEVEPTK